MRRRTIRDSMYYMLQIGFLCAVVNHVTLQSRPVAIVASSIMAVPIAWISWKEGL